MTQTKKTNSIKGGGYKVSLAFIVENLSELGWDYTSGRMSRSGMEIYDGIMRHVGIIEQTEHWNEDVYAESNGDW